MEKMIYTGLPRHFKRKAENFAKRGFELISVPLIEILPISFDEPECEWVLLTSQSPLEFLSSFFLADKKIAVIGKETAAAVTEKLNRKVDFISSVATKVDFVQSFSNAKPVGAIFYPKSNLADNYIEKHLPNLISASVYENHLPENARETLKIQLFDAQVKALYFSSPSTFQRFIDMEIKAENLKFYADGRTTREFVANYSSKNI
ncbi:hypothetical protein Hs30E_02820 [Lactococcus hodotermopsidis]|uniref:Tetrapyrrole biosynthesis uroporphyrinogen III synthase domain-containing protein n=1 Tax=Pseudolactococcus hodotermopsidis TaxID=2709157 RepID=A0A6A0BB98_9LACT|nr:uroporphyrinogen-III synthase [Lactococcus hodotermopsidis]GFH41731.1 hypothetical protein Hs30E_02820 [Lactococcus hodotermopsidis]